MGGRGGGGRRPEERVSRFLARLCRCGPRTAGSLGPESDIVSVWRGGRDPPCHPRSCRLDPTPRPAVPRGEVGWGSWGSWGPGRAGCSLGEASSGSQRRASPAGLSTEAGSGRHCGHRRGTLVQPEAARACRGLRGSPVGTLGKTSDRGHLAHLLTRVRGPRCLCGHPHFLSLLRPVWTNVQQLSVGAPGAKGSGEPWGCGRYSLPQPRSPWDLRPRPLGARFSRHQQSDCGLWPELCSRPRGGAPSRPPRAPPSTTPPSAADPFPPAP